MWAPMKMTFWHVFFSGGEYAKQAVAPSISPSMDICVSSNFERYLFHLFGDDPAALRRLMEAFESKTGAGPVVTTASGCEASPGVLKVPPVMLARAKKDFAAARAGTDEVLAAITAHHKAGYLFCPHSACGVVAVEKLKLADGNTVCLATAHAGKFYDAVQRAVQPLPPLPAGLAAVQTLPMRRNDLPCNLAACQRFVKEKCGFAESEADAKAAAAAVSPAAFVPLLVAICIMLLSSIVKK